MKIPIFALSNLCFFLLCYGVDNPSSTVDKSQIIRVTDRTGKPVSQAKLRIQLKDRFSEVSTGNDGVVRSNEFPDALWIQISFEQVSIKWPGNRIREAALPLELEKRKDGERFRDTAAVGDERLIVVKDYSGNPVKDAQVVVERDSVQFPPKFPTDGEGKARVVPGVTLYRIKVEKNGVELSINALQPGHYDWPLEIKLPMK